MRTALRCLCALLLAATLAACRPPEKVELLFFYSTICPSCEASRIAVTDSVRLAEIAKRHRTWTLATYDVTSDDAALRSMMDAVDRYQVPADKQRIPMLLVNGVAYSGSSEVEAELAALARAGR